MAAAQLAPGADAGHGGHLPVLDGWRGLSILLVLAAHLLPGWPNYFRPHFVAMLVDDPMLAPHTGLVRSLDNRVLLYLALVSYALYVIHPMLAESWLGAGGLAEKYAKRPLLLAVLFALAHLSTNYFERWFIAPTGDADGA